MRYSDALGLAITCRTQVREVRVSKTRCSIQGGCTSIDSLDGSLYRCEYDKCDKAWKFDALIKLSLLVEYSVDPSLPSSSTPGATLRQHEMLHVSDFTAACKSMNSRIKTGGFASASACQAAQADFWNKVRNDLAAARARSHKNRDRH